MLSLTFLGIDDALCKLKQAIDGEESEVREKLENNKAESFSLMGCNFITCFVQESETKYFVIMCAQGENLVKACKQLRIMAKQQDCSKYRIFTKRKGMCRLMNDFNLKEIENVNGLKMYEGDL